MRKQSKDKIWNFLQSCRENVQNDLNSRLELQRIAMLKLSQSWAEMMLFKSIIKDQDHRENLHTCTYLYHRYRAVSKNKLFTVWKNRKFSLTDKNFRQINYLVISLVKPLLLRNFCEKIVREYFCNFHTVCSSPLKKISWNQFLV